MLRYGTLLAVAALVVCAAPVRGDLIIDSENNTILDVTATVGAGANTSYVIIDFAETGGDSWAFAFQWDTSMAPTDPLTSTDMLNAIDAATLLDADISSSDFGSFVNNFSFDGDVGNPDNFWSFTLGEVIDPGIEWTSSPIGIDGRELADGSLDGWYNGFTDEFDSIPPSVPTTQIPTPMSIAAIVPALLCTRRGRRAAVASRARRV